MSWSVGIRMAYTRANEAAYNPYHVVLAEAV
jgi:hypothetical protein